MTLTTRTRDLSPAVLGAALFGFAFLVWLPSVANGFVWDDVNNLVSSDRLTHFRSLFDVFLHDAMWSAEREQAAVGTYRPIALASFVIDFQLYGRKAAGFHFSSVVWHALAAFVLFRAFLRFATPTAAFAMAALWAAHPACAEATAWVNGRSEIFAVLFGAGAIACAGAPRMSVLRWLGTAACLLGALLAKEAGLVFVPVAVWLAGEADGRAGRGWPWQRIHWPAVAAGVVALGLYLALRRNALTGGIAPGVAYSPEALNALTPVWMRSFVTTLAPFDRSLQHLSLWLAALQPEVRTLYSVAAGLLGAVGLWCWFKGRRIATVGLAWWMASLVPVALIAVKSWPGYYRWLVIGLPGLLLFFYHAFRGLIPRMVGVGIACVALVVAVVQTERAIPVWRTGGTLFGAMVDEQPEVDYGYVGLGAWLIEVDRSAEAEEVLRKGVALPNVRPDMWLFLARAISAQDRCDEAVEAADNRVAGRIPAHVAYSLARCYEVTGQWEQAVVAYGKCADYVPICADRLPIAEGQVAARKAQAPATEAGELAPDELAPDTLASDGPDTLASDGPDTLASDAPDTDAPEPQEQP